jgi:TolB-like protein
MNLPQFFKELKRRSVYKAAISYGIVAWFIIQVAETLLPTYDAPIWILKTIHLLLLIGFPVTLVLAWAYEMSPKGILKTTSKSTKSIDSPSSTKMFSLRNIIIAGLFFFLIGQWAYNRFWNTKLDIMNIEKSIAVLPFVNDSPEEENQYFCNGIMEGILDHLSKISELTVISRSSVEQFREDRPTTPEIANKLNVDYIVEGSVQKVNNQVVIFAQLIHAKSDKHLWSEKYNRNLTDVFKIQAEITQIVANKLQTIITPDVKERIDAPLTSNMDAYDNFLRARHIYYKEFFASGDSVDLVRSKVLFERAIDLDSNFAESYAGLSEVYAELRVVNRTGNEQLDSIRTALSQKAYSLDPNSSYVNHVRGWQFRYLSPRQEDSAFYYFKKARKLDPGDFVNYYSMGIMLRTHQLDDLALPYNLEAINIDPLNANLYTQLGYSYWMLGDQEKAENAYQAAFDLGLSYGFSGAPATAFWLMSHDKLDEAKLLIEKHDINWWFLDAHILFLEGNHVEARKMLEVDRNSWSWWGKAEIYALLDEKNKAIDALGRFANEDNWSLYHWLQNTDPWQKYQDDPEFQEVLEIHKLIYDKNRSKYGFEFSEFMSDSE